jgi:CheY-like chemotaxis protein
MRTQDFDVVLMDIQMPVMDGMEAIRRIRAGEAGKGRISLPVVALTAHAMKGDEETLLGAGFDAYLRKPLEADRLLSVLAKLLKG